MWGVKMQSPPKIFVFFSKFCFQFGKKYFLVVSCNRMMQKGCFSQLLIFFIFKLKTDLKTAVSIIFQSPEGCDTIFKHSLTAPLPQSFPLNSVPDCTFHRVAFKMDNVLLFFMYGVTQWPNQYNISLPNQYL